MIDLNQMVNQEIMRERLEARNDLASEILRTIGCPQSPTEYIEKVQKVTERLINVREQYQKFQSGIPL